MNCGKTSAVISKFRHMSLPKKVAKSVKITGLNDSPIEQLLRNEVISYSIQNGVETARIIDKKGMVRDLDIFEFPNHVSVMSKDGKFFGHDFGIIGKLLKTALILRKGTYIHSHTKNMPLSGTDIIFMIRGQVQKVVATTPNGNFSSMEMPKHPKMWLNQKKYLKGVNEIHASQSAKLQKLGLAYTSEEGYKNVTPENLEEYSNLSNQILQNFANKFGFNFQKG